MTRKPPTSGTSITPATTGDGPMTLRNGLHARSGEPLPIERCRQVRIVASGLYGTVVDTRRRQGVEQYRVFDFERPGTQRGWFRADELEPYSRALARLEEPAAIDTAGLERILIGGGL